MDVAPPRAAPLAPVQVVGPSGPLPLVSVLVPCCGRLEYTRLLLPALLRHSRPPVELLFLDVGTLDGSRDYLAGVRDAAPLPVEVVRTATDAGLTAALAGALARARGEFLVLLNNDVWVPEGWLEQLTALARLGPEMGLVGPMANAAAPPQRVDEVPRLRVQSERGPDGLLQGARLDTQALAAFARDYRQRHRGRWLETDHLGGFCLLLKRALLDRLGPVPGQAGLQVFDTEALGQKVREAGLLLAVCADLYIHQFGR